MTKHQDLSHPHVILQDDGAVAVFMSDSERNVHQGQTEQHENALQFAMAYDIL